MQEDANPTPCAKQTAMDSLKPLQNALRLYDLMGFNEATSSFRQAHLAFWSSHPSEEIAENTPTVRTVLL